MSYDLFFRTRDRGARINENDLQAYFQRRKHYQVTAQQAIYQNEDTGVYFLFNFDDAPDDLAKQDNSLLSVVFNINYYRPHVFGLEAEPELAEFIRNFNLLVEDPQNDGLGSGEYTREGFLRGWNHGNKFGCGAMLASNPSPAKPHVLSTSDIERYWKWNIAKESLQDELGDTVFVPKIFFLEWDNKVASGVVWGDAIPSAIPPVDVIVAPRDVLAPSKFLRGRQKDTVVFQWSEVEGIILPFETAGASGKFFLLRYDSPPQSIASLFKNARTLKEKLVGLAVDSILNKELVEEYRK